MQICKAGTHFFLFFLGGLLYGQGFTLASIHQQETRTSLPNARNHVAFQTNIRLVHARVVHDERVGQHHVQAGRGGEALCVFGCLKWGGLWC